jgi:hypothetical protein
VWRCDCEEMSSDGPRTNNGPCREKSRTQDKDATSPTAARLSHWKIAWGLSIVPALILLLPKQHNRLSRFGCLLSAQRVSKGSPSQLVTVQEERSVQTSIAAHAGQSNLHVFRDLSCTSGCTFVVRDFSLQGPLLVRGPSLDISSQSQRHTQCAVSWEE